ncbi:hypothetical protein [Streptomyces sp. NPDC006307]|uniref:hypothetical protein n=1 Tax=Streptomyces sp. NPDC006307 TaxID=3156748 RepID=UPI0033A3F298
MTHGSTHRAVSDHAAVAAAARAERGTWMLAALYPSSATARGVAKHIRNGSEKYPAYLPVGSYEAYAARAGDDEALWVRYVAGKEPVKPLPDHMTVRVRHEGGGPGYEGVGVITVAISTRCPACGGPRGWDTVTAHSFRHDDAWLVVDRWTNPCGHTDMYDAVVRESRDRPLPPPPIALPPGGATGPVAVVLSAAQVRPAMHAAQAALLLEEQGYVNAAELIRAELRARRGHMSAKQAAAYLTECGSPAASLRTTTSTRTTP